MGLDPADSEAAKPSTGSPAAPKSPGRSEAAPGAGLRILLTERLTLTDVRQAWIDTLEESMDDQMPHRSLPECVIELLHRSHKRGRTPQLHVALGGVRPDLDVSAFF